MKIKAEGKGHWGNKFTLNNNSKLNGIEGYKNRIEKYKWGIQENRRLKFAEEFTEVLDKDSQIMLELAVVL